MLAVHAPPASLSRPAARGSRVCPRRATPSVAVGGVSARSAFAALRGAGPRPARRAATRWTRASGADDARPEPRYPGREGAVVDAPVRRRGSDARSDAAPSRAFALFVFTAALSMFAFGVATGSVASALVFLEDASTSAALTTSAKARLVAATPLGAVVGALAAPKAADAVGRKKTLLESAGAAYALGAALCCFAPPDITLLPTFLMFGRFVVGVGAGVSTSVTTMYVSECAPASSRGSAASLCPLFGTAGILASYVAGASLASLVDAAVISPSVAWRVSFGSVLVPVLAQAAMRDCLVESPRWLAASRGEDEARAAARRLGGDVEAELFFEKTIRRQNARRARLADLFATAENRAATRVAFLLNAAQQFCGINVVVYFFPRILKEAFAMRGASAMAVAAAVSAAQVAFGAALARSRVIDTYGRKPVAMCGIAGLICGLACLAVGARFALPVLAVVGVVAFRFSFAASLGPLPYVVTAEAYASSATRATGVSVATATQWACNALVSGTFLPLVDRLGPNRVWLVYLAACVVALVAVARFAPETKDARLE